MSYDMNFIHEACDAGAVIQDSTLHMCGSVAEAIAFYQPL